MAHSHWGTHFQKKTKPFGLEPTVTTRKWGSPQSARFMMQVTWAGEGKKHQPSFAQGHGARKDPLEKGVHEHSQNFPPEALCIKTPLGREQDMSEALDTLSIRTQAHDEAGMAIEPKL